MIVLAGCTRRPPPNVVIVTFDTTRYDRIGANGDPGAKTPVVDALATRGLRFERAYSSIGLTLPAHTTIMSGLEPIVHGVHNNGKFRVPKQIDTLAERLAKAGYETAAFVSAYVLNATYHLDQGFEVYDDETRDPGGALSFSVPSRPAGEVTAAALKWLEKRSPDKPFFLWAHYYDPHMPYQAKAPYDAIGDPYAAEIAYADSELGKLLEAVGAREGERGTLVVFTADHGESFGEHGEATHGLVAYDSTLHVPLVIAGPGVPKGVVSPTYARHIDLAPTILAAAGLGAPHELEGRDLVRAATASDEGIVGYFESKGPHFDLGWTELAGVRTARWKYTALPEPRELYDVVADPREVRNVLDEEPEARREMEALWESYRSTRAGARIDAAAGGQSVEELEKLAALGYVQAPRTFDEAQAPDPRAFVAVHSWVDHGRTLATMGRYDDAIEALETIGQSPSVRGLVLRSLASVYAERGKIDDAIRVYREYIALTDSTEARLGLGRTLLNANRPAEALAMLDELKDRLSMGVVFYRAIALSRMGRTTEARAAIDEGFPGPRLRQPRLRQRAALVLDAAPIADGEAELRGLLGELPEDPVLKSRVGYYLAVWGPKEKGDEALELLRAAVVAQPKNAELLANLGWGAYKLGHDEEAVEKLEAALEERPESPLDRFRLAHPLKRLGRNGEALGLVRRALKLQPAASWAPEATKMLAELEPKTAAVAGSRERKGL